ncbi:MAG TPA: M14 family metallopeptidase [Chloroflexaceae bacterium]|nr:M14 family metallopeptidase [Chloroflexaceae bacterium]
MSPDRQRRGLLRLSLLVVLTTLFIAPVSASRRTATITNLTIGRSTEGRPITAIQVGGGPRKLVLVGATHGGPEANTYRLMLDLIAHLRAAPEEVPPEVRLYLIPALNPDGLALETRFNARGVDLNRNMDTGLDACPENDWSRTVNGAYGIVSDTGGPSPESEAESRLIRSFLLDASAAIFYHSAGGELFPPFCEHAPSLALAQRYAEVAGYTYIRYYPRYMITGGMHDWAGSLGIASFTPELWTGEGSDTDENHAALHAILADAAALLPLPENQRVGAYSVPAPIWRFWRSNGGATRLGNPTGPARIEEGRLVQPFMRAIVVVDPARVDTAEFVSLAPLGERARALLTSSSPTAFRTEAAEYASLFSAAAAQLGGEALLGERLGAPEPGVSVSNGAPRIVQYFANARLELDPSAAARTVLLSPLGWHDQQLRMVTDPGFTHQIR